MTGREPWLSLVGIGEDGIDGLSPTARARVEGAELVVGGRRHLALAAALIRGEKAPWCSPIEATLPAILACRGRPVCVLATGDPFHYGVGALLARHVPTDETRCWPQPSAFSLAAARLGWSLEACRCLSVHGRDLARVVPVLQHGAQLLILSWDGDTPAQLAALLTKHGFGASVLRVCEAMGGPAERLRETTAVDFGLSEVAALNLLACTVVIDRGARQVPLTPGLPDGWFAHDGQITKAPMRALTLAALAPRPSERLWDIGSGSGSVAIEWLLAGDTAGAVAVERHLERADRIAANASHWGVAERLTLVRGSAPEALAGLPAPNAAFVGGGLGEPGMLDAVQQALPSGGRLVANAVTLESQALLSGRLNRYGGDLTMLNIARAERVGEFHGLRPAMPVLQWRWSKP